MESSERVTPAGYVLHSSFVLTVLYASVAGATGFQVLRTLYYKHDLLSYQFGFTSLCLVWALLRTAFFALYHLFRAEWMYLWLFGLPVNFQFATYSLLVVYFANRVHSNRRGRGAGRRGGTGGLGAKRAFGWVWLTVNAVLLVAHLAIVVGSSVAARRVVDNSSAPEDERVRIGMIIAKVDGYFFALVFAILVVALVVYAVLLVRSERSQAPASSTPETQAPTSLAVTVTAATPLKTATGFMWVPSRTRLAVLSSVIFGVYAIRAVWDVLDAERVVYVRILPTVWHQHVLLVVMFLLWEILPISVVIWVFGSVPATRYRPVAQRRAALVVSAPSPSRGGGGGRAGRAVPSRFQLRRGTTDGTLESPINSSPMEHDPLLGSPDRDFERRGSIGSSFRFSVTDQSRLTASATRDSPSLIAPMQPQHSKPPPVRLSAPDGGTSAYPNDSANRPRYDSIGSDDSPAIPRRTR